MRIFLAFVHPNAVPFCFSRPYTVYPIPITHVLILPLPINFACAGGGFAAVPNNNVAFQPQGTSSSFSSSFAPQQTRHACSPLVPCVLGH